MLNRRDRAYFAKTFRRLGLPPLYEEFEFDSVESGGAQIQLSILKASPDAPTIVFFPGTAVYALTYAELLVGLRDSGFNVAGLDPRGHGRSEGRRGDFTVPDLIEDGRAAIGYAAAKFGGPIFLMGSSQGGIVTFYAATVETRLKGAICHNIADLSDPESARLSRFPAFVPLMRPGLSLFSGALPRLPLPLETYLDLSKERVRGFGDAKKYIDQDPFALHSISIRALHSLATCPPPKPIESIRIPVLVLHSEGDHIFPRDYVEKQFNRLNCPKKLAVFPGLPHLILTEHAPEVLPTVVEWIEKTARGAN